MATEAKKKTYKRKTPYRGKSATRETMEEKFAKKFLEDIASGNTPLPTRARQPGAVYMPGNLTTLRPYSGFNSVSSDMVAVNGITKDGKSYQEACVEKYGRDVGSAIANKFVTFDQAKNLFGGAALKGSKQDVVILTPGFKTWKDHEGKKFVRKDENGKERDPTKEEIMNFGLTLSASRGGMRGMFSAAQFAIEHDIPDRELNKIKKAVDKLIQNPIEHMKNEQITEDVLEAMNAKLVDENTLQDGVGGYYANGTNKIAIRSRASYENQDHYMRVFFHEMTHMTGREDLLNRETLRGYGDTDKKNRSKEEMTAEIGSAMLCSYFGIETKELGHSGYVLNWMENVKEDPKNLLNSIKDAQRGVNMIIDKYEMHVEKKYNYDAKKEKENLEIPYDPNYKPLEKDDVTNEKNENVVAKKKSTSPSPSM